MASVSAHMDGLDVFVKIFALRATTVIIVWRHATVEAISSNATRLEVVFVSRDSPGKTATNHYHHRE